MIYTHVGHGRITTISQTTEITRGEICAILSRMIGEVLMVDPFMIRGPAVVSFSGGRTSGLMLRRVIDAGLQPDVHVLFANTGKEREETLSFVNECAIRWGVCVVWLEYDRGAGYRRVSFETSSRNGEPFAELIRIRKFLPNPVTRFCTSELKILVMKKWMIDAGYDHWTNIVGLRADEPHRVAKQRAGSGKERWDIDHPLFTAGITEADVLAFWKAQPFDLRLERWEGNCDLCFLKGRKKRERIMRDRPDLSAWWIDQERLMRSTFRSDTIPYEALNDVAQRPMLPFGDLSGLDDLGDCVCHE